MTTERDWWDNANYEVEPPTYAPPGYTGPLTLKVCGLCYQGRVDNETRDICGKCNGHGSYFMPLKDWRPDSDPYPRTDNGWY